jgi:hypothetical protein
VLAVVVLAVAGGMFAFSRRYLGMTEGMWNMMRYTSPHEGRNLWFCVDYFLDAMAGLTWNAAAGRWDFERTPQPRGGLERGRLAFHRGDYSRAIALLTDHLRRAGESEEGLFWLALAYMRRAEAQNCLAPLHGQVATTAAGPAEPAAPAPSPAAMPAAPIQDPPPAASPMPDPPADDPALFCSLPLRRFHDRQDDSRQAMRLLERLLDRYRPDDPLYRWLLNFSAMTVNGFPGEVPARYRIQGRFVDTFYGAEAARMRSKYGWLRFRDRARELGIGNFGTNRGVAVEDFDGDGFLDVVTASFYGSLRYYRNLGGKGFADVTAEAGLAGVEQPLSVSAADFNNDGAMDLLVVRPFDHFLLFAGDGKGHFKDVTAASGLLDGRPADTLAASWFAAWGDVNGDGLLDLFLTSWAFRIPFATGLVAKPRLDSKLFINEGHGHFRDATAEYGLAGLVADRQFIGAAFGDYDGDGWPDLFIAGPIPGTSALLHNEGGRRFVKVPGLDLPETGFTAAFVDVNQDGRLDVFQAGFNDARTATERTVFGAPGFTMGPSLFLVQTPAGGFEKRPDLFAGGVGAGTMGVGYGDLDNDGCLDFYLGSGDPEPWFILPHRMYHGEEIDGRCTGRLEDVSMLDGFGNVQKGHAVVFFDFDNDGRQDVLSVLGGMWPADSWTSQLFVNESELHNHWVKVRLRGRRTNSFGVGARIKVTARRPDGRRIVRYRQMDNGTGFGSAPYLAHVGLMDAVAIEGIEVFWPASRCRWSYPAGLDRLVVLDEADCLAARGTGGGPAAGVTVRRGEAP